MNRIIQRSIICLSLPILFLSGCGGSGGGTSSDDSVQSPAPVVNSPVTGSVSITGSNQVGSVVSIEQNLADSNGLGSFEYQWLLDGVAIAGATGDTYTIISEDVGQTLAVIIRFTDSDGFDESVLSGEFRILETPSEQATNILFIISDDHGLDASNQYNYTNDAPVTPNLDQLADSGIVFENVWVTPACTTTRAAILTGMHGINSGVSFVPATLDTSSQTIAKYLKSSGVPDAYATAAFGKWHLAGGRDTNLLHPNESGFDHYAGNLSNIDDYYQWELTINGEQQTSSNYHTSEITTLALNWIQEQQQPWFVWLAYQAPHSPFHLPPTELHDRNQLTGDASDINANTREYYLAAIDAMDTEIGRLLDSMDDQTLDNTLVIFIGDNGTPRGVIDTGVYQRTRAKGTLYEGGIRVPMFVAGRGVTRSSAREERLVNATDFYTTLGQVAGMQTAQLYDSTSFFDVLTDANATSTRENNYSEFESDDVTGWTVKDDTLKYIQFEDGSHHLFAIDGVLDEGTDLAGDTAYSDDIQRFVALAADIRNEQNQSPIDITNQFFTSRSTDCESYVESYQSSVMDINNSRVFSGALMITVDNEKCIFQTNAIPHHDFNDGDQSFPNDVSEQDDRYEVTTQPTFAAQNTSLSLRTDNAIMLNGVKVDLLAAGCFGVGNGRTGCADLNQPWRYDPVSARSGFNIDSHNAHSQGDGTYHYHGAPPAFYQQENTGEVSPVVGFAADGFPIYGAYFDDNGTVRKAVSSYQLKSGSRPEGDGQPGGDYDGTFRDDYEYIEGVGDLDECNGMTIDGHYGYYMTDGFPYILGCLKGTPDPSFDK
ncbi:YHYH protein [Alteromonas sp. KUL49]|uniref:YHYH protein n=1 Tax=Alteromonas sp. KUL49 TaxID=2480798 RepID=UPI00102F2A8B|nr:YHYH protein [Alteromonas sp. KUL49]TAP40364.1 YHYH protein [Alteromonas sp. KUL49]GEA11518.1 hypothetical protein KUL49_18930 [Alteromonas sp. KUL49]